MAHTEEGRLLVVGVLYDASRAWEELEGRWLWSSAVFLCGRMTGWRMPSHMTGCGIYSPQGYDGRLFSGALSSFDMINNVLGPLTWDKSHMRSLLALVLLLTENLNSFVGRRELTFSNFSWLLTCWIMWIPWFLSYTFPKLGLFKKSKYNDL